MKGTYRVVERVFLPGLRFLRGLPDLGVLAHPDWTRALIDTVKPSAQLNAGNLYMIIGLVGTTIAPWMQFYLQSAVVEKGIKLKHYRHSRWDVIIGCIITDVVAFFIIIACAATIYATGHRQIADAGDAAVALRPLAGRRRACSSPSASATRRSSRRVSCRWLRPITSARDWASNRGSTSALDEAPTFYALYTGLIVLGRFGVLVIRESMQVPIILLSQVANGIILPFVLIFMLRLCNREDLMGTYRNARAFNMIAWVTCIVMIALTLLLVLSSMFPASFAAAA